MILIYHKILKYGVKIGSMRCRVPLCLHDFPCKTHVFEIQSWKIGYILYEKDTKMVFTTRQSTDTGYPWVMKCSLTSNVNEVAIIQTLNQHAVRHIVESPTKLTYYGNLDDVSWYVMKYYPRVCCSLNDYKDFPLLMRTCLEFVQDLHIKTGYVYIDWRLDNILKLQENGFVISDYEFLEKPHTSSITFIDEYFDNKDYLYYFLQRGVQVDKPFIRYRNDLEFIGFLAMKFLDSFEPTWSVQCNKIRNKKIKPIPVDVLSELRNTYKQYFLESHTPLRNYFEKIQECSWDSLECMPSQWYDELIAIFDYEI